MTAPAARRQAIAGRIASGIAVAFLLFDIAGKLMVIPPVVDGMGQLGGAVATNLRAGNPLVSHVLFPTYLGLFIWVGLWLREPRIRGVFPLVGGDRAGL